jgi:hypothetical protein
MRTGRGEAARVGNGSARHRPAGRFGCGKVKRCERGKLIGAHLDRTRSMSEVTDGDSLNVPASACSS